jgi:superfamily II DNA or RNA helicase
MMNEVMTQKINEVRDVEQKKALNAWAAGGYYGSIIAGTGFGKSRCGVLAVANTLNKSDIPFDKALVLVPTIQLQDQFREEFKKWGHEILLDKVDIICYQSAHKLKDKRYEIIVCDEVHLGLSPVYRKVLNNNIYGRLLCMTATPPEEEEYRELLDAFAPTVYSISLDECVQKGLVAEYEIYCVPVELDEDERAAYKKHNNLFVQMKYKLGGFNAFQNAQAIMSGKMIGDKGAAAMFYRAIRGRKEIVQHAWFKIDEAIKIIDHYHNAKILTFSGSNAFTDSMAESITDEGNQAAIYHSKRTKKQREKALEDFRNGDVNILCSTKALNQGLDIKGAEVGIIAGLDSKSLPMIQRIGRLIRKDGDKIGKVYILYVKDSQEEKWLNEAIKNLNNITRDVDLTNHFSNEC